MKQAESLIDELLEWSDSTAEPNLGQIEGVVLELRKRFSEEMAREVIEAQEAKQPAPELKCTPGNQATGCTKDLFLAVNTMAATWAIKPKNARKIQKSTVSGTFLPF